MPTKTWNGGENLWDNGFAWPPWASPASPTMPVGGADNLSNNSFTKNLESCYLVEVVGKEGAPSGAPGRNPLKSPDSDE
jgi:hypothetical protein